ncbi:MAG TPA: phosphoribosylamine--glycine ligase [Thermodesulfobacteriota bacterium]|nr:phosphoribosylamine--glycine ligase [Thermodesulfobacteriota bacterium]
MKVLVIGSGGREHALCWKIKQSPLVKKLYCAPGNAGISNEAECVDISVSDFDSLTAFVKEHGIDLTIVGPEQPLSEGIVDVFENEGLKIFGPSKAAAELEGSKAFSKNLMKKYNIPTASYQTFTDLNDAISWIKKIDTPFVVKADGLAAGKGVVICNTVSEGEKALNSIMKDKIFGTAGSEVVIEEFLTGEEASFFVFTDGKDFVELQSSQDHKAVYDGDKGPNTGGMGAYSPAPIVNETLRKKIIDTVVVPTINAMESEGRTYKGILYIGLMIEDQNFKVLEYNCRFGDPEAQPLLFRLKSDIVPIFNSIASSKLGQKKLEWKTGYSVCVVMASNGYPGSYEKGYEIGGLEDLKDKDDIYIFHAGTKFSNNKVVTSGGRVLGITSLDNELMPAINKAYDTIKMIDSANLFCRTDIGKKAIKYL